jgi:hypothetical protein
MSRAWRDQTRYLQPAFVICAAVLALAAAGMSVAEKRLGLYLKKEPLPLKKPLDEIDEAKLAPYRVVAKQKIENRDVLESLGTEDYIQWVLEDPCSPVDSAVRNVLLFVTYYGRADRVPHVPEECYTGGGYQRIATSGVEFKLGPGAGLRSIPGRYLVFAGSNGHGWQAGSQFPVLYLFRVNGEYAGNRDDARMALNKSIFSPHAYFCKIEMAFNQGYAAPGEAEAVGASERLLTLLLPVLEREHWPD